jgi:hypothetical protein
MKSPQTFNRYSYVLNNPLTRVDPAGLLDMLYVLQTMGVWDSSVSDKQVKKAAEDTRKSAVVVSHATTEELLSGARKADRTGTDVVVVVSHTIDNNKEGAHEQIATWKPVGWGKVSAKDIAGALKDTKPQLVILLGCSTAEMARQLSGMLGVRTVGMTGDFNEHQGFSEFNTVLNDALQGQSGVLTGDVEYRVFDPPKP